MPPMPEWPPSLRIDRGHITPMASSHRRSLEASERLLRAQRSFCNQPLSPRNFLYIRRCDRRHNEQLSQTRQGWQPAQASMAESPKFQGLDLRIDEHRVSLWNRECRAMRLLQRHGHFCAPLLPPLPPACTAHSAPSAWSALNQCTGAMSATAQCCSLTSRAPSDIHIVPLLPPCPGVCKQVCVPKLQLPPHVRAHLGAHGVHTAGHDRVL